MLINVSDNNTKHRFHSLFTLQIQDVAGQLKCVDGLDMALWVEWWTILFLA